MKCSIYFAKMAVTSENISFDTLETGQKIKITKTVVKKHRDVERRKHLVKFGECAGNPSGPEPGITTVDEVELIPTFGIPEEKQDQSHNEKIENTISCRHCGGDHWSAKCPKHKSEEKLELSKSNLDYVPPHKRNVLQNNDKKDNNDACLFVSNLSEDTTNAELAFLFSPFGEIKRLSVPTNKKSGLTKGFAFISFWKRRDAEAAFEHRFCHNHMILKIKWAG